MKKWVVQIIETRTHEIVVHAETKKEAEDLDEGFLVEIIKGSCLSTEIEIEALGELIDVY